MYEYKGGDYEGVTIVDFGLSLNVTDGVATVEYNGFTSHFKEALQSRSLASRTDSIDLNADQLAWLEDKKTWVKHQIEASR